MSGREGGSGLGLPLAQTLVAQNHGTIECESRPGRTVFSIILPLPTCSHDKNQFVWIIDDDRSIRWVLEKALEREDIACMTFSSAGEALRRTGDAAQPAAVLSDIRMPGVSGLEFLQALKERLPKAAGHHHDRLFRSG